MSSYTQSEKRDVQTAMAMATEEFAELMPGQIRMDLDTNRLIILRTAVYDDAEFERTDFPWSVKDLLTGAIYLRNDVRFGEKIYVEMEALAWAAQDHPEVDWLSD